MGIDITSVKIFPHSQGNEELKAYASIVIDGEFVVNDIRLVETDEKVIVAMPNKKQGGTYSDIAHPIANGCRHKIRESVVEAYNGHPEVEEEITFKREKLAS